MTCLLILVFYLRLPLGPLFMPLAEVVLDGSGSTDDLSISSWQWQRLSDSVAAGTVVGKSDGPLLVLTDLVDGIYSFSLKVSSKRYRPFHNSLPLFRVMFTE